MKKTIFKNKGEEGYEEYPISAERLMGMQDDIETEINSLSYAAMITNISSMAFTTNENTKVEGVWDTVASYGDYKVDEANSRLEIKNTELVQVSGTVSGSGPASARLTLKTQDNSIVDQIVMLMQPAGNGYFSIPLQARIFKLDPTKIYYLELLISNYNDNFYLNAGFGVKGTNIEALKIK